MRDIENRDDIMLIMRSFYVKLLADPSISYLFTEVVKVDLEHHFPVLVDFWDGMLFGTGAYRKNAMQPHLDMAKKSPLTKEHFETWLKYLFASSYQALLALVTILLRLGTLGLTSSASNTSFITFLKLLDLFAADFIGFSLL